MSSRLCLCRALFFRRNILKTGCLYFITDLFYEKFDNDETLMKNKEAINGQNHDRPCFFAIRDVKDKEIYWLVPLSSKVDKYEAIVNKKVQKMIEKGKEKPECNTIRFGEVLGNKTVFLIQNMFPTTSKYIKNVYIDKNTNNNVTLPPDVTSDIIKNAKQVLKLHKRGINLTYGNIDTIYSALCEELKKDRNTLAALKSVLHQHEEILRLNPELNENYQQAAKCVMKYNSEMKREMLIDTELSINEQLNIALALRNECNKVILSDSQLKQDYIAAKKIYLENVSKQKTQIENKSVVNTVKDNNHTNRSKKPSL